MNFANKELERACARADTEANGANNHLEIDRLARLSTFEYDRQREGAAGRLGVRVGTLDRMVKEKRASAEDDAATLPHWKVEPSSELVDGAALLDSLRQIFRRYIVLPKGADIALPLWVLHAWTMNAGEISPFIVLVSPTKRCGKTSVLILLYFLTPRSELASNISAAALFRYIEEVRPTLLVDEADTFVKDNEELRGILNSGHTKTAANVIRNVEINGEHKPRRFSTWAPKAIAAIRGLADTLEDRSVTIMLQRKPPGAKVAPLRRRDSEEFATLRGQAARWAADNFDKLVDPEPQMPKELNDRAADNWRPLLAIADLAGETWSREAREGACLLSGEAHDGAIGVELLKDIRLAFGGDSAMRSVDLVAKLIADPERPWAEWKYGRPLTQKQLGGLLRPFCIISETVSAPGLNDAKGYKRVHFEKAWAAYCPDQDTLSQQIGTSEAPNRRNADGSKLTRDFRSVAEANGDASKNTNLSYSHAGSDASTDRKHENGAKSQTDQDLTDDIPESLRRCDYCGRPNPDGQWDWPGRSSGIRLHSRCEQPWYARAAADRSGDGTEL
jgi:putative DNA primase/helicase